MKDKTASGRTKRIVPLLITAFVLLLILFYGIIGQDAQMEVADNLDLFPPQYAVLKHTHTFFSQHVTVPFLGGLDRDYLPTEFSLVAFCYMLFPPFAAMIACYVLKIVIAVLSGYALAKEVANTLGFREKLQTYQDRILLCAFAFGTLNLFPHFGIMFASLPLLVYLLLRIARAKGKQLWLFYAVLFFYPLLSYFSYFGLFLMAYLALGVLILWGKVLFRQKKHTPALRMTIALFVLCAGTICMEYRLFRLMLFSDEPTIRTTMRQTNLTLSESLSQALDVFLHGDMHTTDVHLYAVIPLMLFYFAFVAYRYWVIKDRTSAAIRTCRYALYTLLLILFNCLICGLSYYEPFRNLLEMLLPPLKGFQFGRTVFLNPFLWYLMLCLILCSLGKKAGTALAVAACALVICIPVPYNDLYHSAYAKYYALRHEGKGIDVMSVGEFYAQELFEEAKKDIGYRDSEYAVAYGLYPAVLQMNGIATLDGYLGYYPVRYHQAFRAVIAPALARSKASADYFDNWGARCYMDPGTGMALGMQQKSLPGFTDDILYADTDALKQLNCRYLFSRILLSNAAEKNLTLTASYEGDGYPFALYIYMLQ